MRRLLVRAVVIGSLIVGVAAPLFAQQGTSDIGGKVTDEQGAVLPGASVIITNEETGAVREMTTVAPGRTAPCSSVTLPPMSDVPC